MRKIGIISNREHATRFADFLFSAEIPAHVDQMADNTFAIWVEDEDRLTEAGSLLSAFLEDPDHKQYLDAAEKADQRRRAARKEQAAFSRQVFDRKRISRRARLLAIPVTRILILLSVAATLFGGLGSESEIAQWLSVTRYRLLDDGFVFQRGLPEVLRGQVWRLFTPVFLHASLLDHNMGLLHIFFNMFWLLDLGGMIERLQGGKSLLIKVLVIGVFSNVLQYQMAGPAFGGMSGVVYGLLGYSWIRGRQDLTSGLFVSPQIMFLMTFWFLLGFSGFMGSI
ncbi:MAG: rhomboid family intramembrane serine protease, partial [Kiritimatiellia bacterium]